MTRAAGTVHRSAAFQRGVSAAARFFTSNPDQETSPMANPWTKKNPFMSLWLSSANRVANQARGQASAAASRQKSALIAQGARFWVRLRGM